MCEKERDRKFCHRGEEREREKERETERRGGERETYCQDQLR